MNRDGLRRIPRRMKLKVRIRCVTRLNRKRVLASPDTETPMKRILIWIYLIWLGLSAGCAVMTKEVTREALPQRPFDEMVRQTERYMGQTVIMGGYVISVENQKGGTKLILVQAPLGAGQKPKSKDLSKGRLVVLHSGFLDPEIYVKDRAVTVGGSVTGSSQLDQTELPYPYIRIQAKEVYLWPEVEAYPVDPFWYHDCYPYRYSPWRRYHHPWCW